MTFLRRPEDVLKTSVSAGLLLNLANLRDLFGFGTKLQKIYSRTTTKSFPLLQPEHGHCQQNGPERGQLLYPNEKILVIPVCLNGRCCIVLIKTKAMNLCLFKLFEDILSL